MFLQEPKNVTVSEGADAFFACIYHGTTGVPVWRIANDVFVASALPPRHSYKWVWSSYKQCGFVSEHEFLLLLLQ